MATCELSRFATCESSRLVSFLDCPYQSPFSLSDFIIFGIFLTSQFAAAIEDDDIISDKLPCGLGKIDSTCSSLLAGSIFLKYFNNVILRNSEFYF